MTQRPPLPPLMHKRLFPDVQANTDRVKAMFEALLRRLEQHTRRHNEVSFADILMTAHNFHKVTILGHAERLHATGHERRAVCIAASRYLEQMLLEHCDRLDRAADPASWRRPRRHN